jgi:hypothetical protein
VLKSFQSSSRRFVVSWQKQTDSPVFNPHQEDLLYHDRSRQTFQYSILIKKICCIMTEADRQSSIQSSSRRFVVSWQKQTDSPVFNLHQEDFLYHDRSRQTFQYSKYINSSTYVSLKAHFMMLDHIKYCTSMIFVFPHFFHRIKSAPIPMYFFCSDSYILDYSFCAWNVKFKCTELCFIFRK